jgi:dTMP kinase
MRGLFITFEGVEGSGKSSQIVRLEARLRAQGVDVVCVREPGGEPMAERIRALLLDAASDLEDRAELLLFLAARAQVVSRVVAPAVARGAVVLGDRHIDSSVAYQGWGRQQDVAAIRSLNAFAVGGVLPDRTLLLDLAPETGLGRQMDRNRMEAEPAEFHARVRQGFLSEARHSPERFRVIDASGSPAEVEERIHSALSDLAPELGRAAG